jgi:hypothetical protein
VSGSGVYSENHLGGCFVIRFVNALVVLVLTAATSRGEFIVNITQVGSDVVATGSGTIDTTSLTATGPLGASAAQVVADAGIILMGPAPVAAPDGYSGFTGPAAFGTSAAILADSATGDRVSMRADTDLIYVPAGYVSGQSLSDSDTWDNTTIADLGLTPGTYTWTWGSGATADSFVLNISATAAPEPASLTLLATAFGCVALGRSLRRRERLQVAA